MGIIEVYTSSRDTDKSLFFFNTTNVISKNRRQANWSFDDFHRSWFDLKRSSQDTGKSLSPVNTMNFFELFFWTLPNGIISTSFSHRKHPPEKCSLHKRYLIAYVYRPLSQCWKYRDESKIQKTFEGFNRYYTTTNHLNKHSVWNACYEKDIANKMYFVAYWRSPQSDSLGDVDWSTTTIKLPKIEWIALDRVSRASNYTMRHAMRSAKSTDSQN